MYRNGGKKIARYRRSAEASVKVTNGPSEGPRAAGDVKRKAERPVRVGAILVGGKRGLQTQPIDLLGPH